jgi:tetratricopeptide (TPR) repeat protein
VVVALLCTVPVVLGITNWSRNDRSRDTFADRYGRTVLDLVERDAVLLLYADSDTGPIGYLHTVEGLRPDLTLYNLQGLVFRSRIVPALARPRVRQERLQAFLAQERRPVYHMTDKILPPGLAEEHLGFVKRVRTGAAPGRPRAVYRPGAEQFFRALRQMREPRDRWIRMTRNQLLHQYGTFLALARLDPDAALRARVATLLDLAEGNYYSLTGMVEVLAEHGTSREDWARARAYLERADRLKDDSLDAERQGREYYLRGFVAFRLGDATGAASLFQQSVEIHPSSANASHLALQQLAQLRQQGPR